MNVRLLILLLILFALPITHAATIQIGVRRYYPPFELLIAQKEVSGFEVDLITEVCKRMRVTCSFKPLLLDELFKAVQAKKISLAIGAIVITEERQASFLFSLPYLASKGQFITQRSNNINSIPEICKKRIGVVEGSIYKVTAVRLCSGIPQIIGFPQALDAYKAMENGYIDALITDEKSARYWDVNNENLYKLVGSSIPEGMGYGIMANRDDTGLINNVNKALVSMENDGTYLKIYKLYFS